MEESLRLKILLEKYLEDKNMNADEILELKNFIQDDSYSDQLDGLLKDAFNNTEFQESDNLDLQAIFQDVMLNQKTGQEIEGARQEIKIKRISFLARYKYLAAAVVLIAFSFGLYFMSSQNSFDKQELVNDIAPGKNRATLTLSDGRKIALSESKDGIVVSDDEIKYNDGTGLGNQLLDEIFNETQYATLTTPKGGQYQLTLPDGTKVWLNASSSLKYPIRFNSKERQVILEGEGYFEVKPQLEKDSHLVPFVVKTALQEIKVLGTRFNVNSYVDEPSIKTTLLEGSVEVLKSDIQDRVLLKPNQQSALYSGSKSVEVYNVDPSLPVAWKNGLFQFDNSDIQTVMRQLVRWYDLEIEYKGEIPKETFNGKVYRNMTLKKVLEVLSFSQIDFELKGRKMIIYSNSDKSV